MTKLEEFKRNLKLGAWARHKAEQEGTRTFDLNHKWINDKEFRAALIRKWEQIALERQEEILAM